MIDWLSSAENAAYQGLSKCTLLRIRALPDSPFQDGIHYRWKLSRKGTLQWDPEATALALSSWKRCDPLEVETYSKGRFANRRNQGV